MSNSYSGVITEKKEKQSGSKDGKSWANQQFLIKTEGQYPKDILFVAKNKTIEWLDKKNVGEKVTVEFDLQARTHKGVIYQDAIAYSIK